MQKIKLLIIFLIIIVYSISCNNMYDYPIPPNSFEETELPSPAKVTLSKEGSEWKMFVNDEEYYIKGAAPGESTYIESGRSDYYYGLLAENGGNTIRTYGINEHTQNILDAAYEQGIGVCLGLWVAKEIHNFDYNNEVAVKAQLESLREQVLRYKDHPALLIWFVGNEPDASYTNLKLWNAINDICAMIHEVDPNHPTTTAITTSDVGKIKAIMERVPELDILSMNVYAALPNVLGNLQTAGWEKPYMITEFGPRGTWQLPSNRITEWGVCVEETSTEKEAVYLNNFQNHIAPNRKHGCIGSFAFVWGYQTTGSNLKELTWYGLHDREGRSFGGVDALQYCWTGNYPSNRAPIIASRADMLLNDKRAEDNIKTPAGSNNQARVTASDPDGDPLEYEWLISEVGAKDPDGGPHSGISGLIQANGSPEVTFTAPSAPGAYWLYVYVRDNHHKVASAVIPFLVE